MRDPLMLAAEGVCAPAGFSAGVAASGIRGDGNSDRLDVAVIVTDPPAIAAGVFTRNRVKAAPVVVSQLTLRRQHPVSAVLINSGNANACTGPQGLRDALVACKVTAEAIGVDPLDVLVCSTGVIGRPMPMDRLNEGIGTAVRSLHRGGGRHAARAIMTTDTRPKTAVASFTANGHVYTVGGMAKGSGMIHPDMATLLAVVTTDAPVADATMLQSMLSVVVADTFNCISVDGDTSTNDTLLVLANGAGGGAPITAAMSGSLQSALHSVCESLAEQVVADGEGATKHFTITVRGAPTVEDARAAARTVATSPLVKTAINGNDPNWGRIAAALGRSGVAFSIDHCRITIAGVDVFREGSPTVIESEAAARLFASEAIDIDIDLGNGSASGRAWGCDLSAEYVHINADYTT